MAIAYHHWESLPLKGIDSGPVKTVKVCVLINENMVTDNLHGDMNCEADLVSWAACYGTDYCPGFTVCSKTED